MDKSRGYPRMGEKPGVPESQFPYLPVAGLWLVLLTLISNVTVRTRMLDCLKLT